MINKSHMANKTHMVKIDKSTILKISHLANLPVDEKNIGLRIKQFQETLDTVKILEEIDTKGVAPSFSASEKQNVWREDEILPSLPRDEALKNAKRKLKGYFMTEAVKRRK